MTCYKRCIFNKQNETMWKHSYQEGYFVKARFEHLGYGKDCSSGSLGRGIYIIWFDIHITPDHNGFMDEGRTSL